ncbi:MAG: hypothetical protein JXR76_21845 [Deltaproteobacteria bacterium]|nr:hypothetical protein [Deltaproteobacteria bacterium]
MKKAKIIASLLLGAIWLAGCGGADVSKETSLKDRSLSGTPDDYDPVDAILGNNPDLDMAAAEAEENGPQEQEQMVDNGPVEADKDYIGGTMAVFFPTVLANGEEIRATYKVVTADANANVVMDNVKSGVETEISPGTYDVTFTTNKIAGDPELTLRGIELQQGRRLTRQVKFPVGEITLATPGGGCKRSAIKIRQKGATDWMKGKFTTCAPIKLMAGEYEAKQGSIEISGIQVYDGGTRTVTVRKQ